MLKTSVVEIYAKHISLYDRAWVLMNAQCSVLYFQFDFKMSELLASKSG